MGAKIDEFVRTCYQCGICSGVCPKARVKKGFLPRRMVYDAITGNSSRVISSGDAWDCLTCRQCTTKCPMKVDFVDMISSTRSEMMERGLPHNFAHENTFGTSLFNIMKDKGIKPRRKEFLSKDVKINDRSDTLYFMGCMTYLDIIFKDDVGYEGMEIADSTIKLMNKIGIEPAIWEGEKCCGHDQLWRGQSRIFEDLARQNTEKLKKYKTIIVSCPECYRTLAVDYKERLGVELKVKHISEVLIENKDKLKGKGDKKEVTYHDSCRLGRYMNVYDAPRELLRNLGYEIKEMEYNRENALCCGVPQWVNCDDENKEVRRRKMKDALSTGAGIMITPCVKCQIHLKCLQRDKKEPDYNIEIVDLSTALMRNLEDEKDDS